MLININQKYNKPSVLRLKIIFLFFVSTLLTIYIFIASNSFGFDDEFNTINIIESLNFSSMYRYLQSNDIHPPLSYIFDKLLFNIFQDWSIVRVFLSIVVVASITNLAYKFFEDLNIRSICLLIFLGFDPNILIWGTSIRWYTYYLIILCWFLIIPRRNTNWFYIKQLLGFLLLGHIGYITFLLFVPLFIYYNLNPIKNYKNNFSKLVITYLILLTLYSYQLYIFLTIHVQSDPAKGNYNFPLTKNLIGFISGVFSNQGVMPFSLAGILSIFSFVFILYFHLKESIKIKRLIDLTQIYFISLLLFFVSGVGGFIRIFVILSPFKALLITNLRDNKFLYKLLCSILLLTQLQGFFNFIYNKGTTKSYWNIPHKTIFTELKKENAKCNDNLIIFHHDMALSFHLNREGLISISPFENIIPYSGDKNILNTSPYSNNNKIDEIINSQSNECVALVDTFRGHSGLSYDFKRKLMEAVNHLKYQSLRTINFGKNNDTKINRIISKDYPDFRAKLYFFKNVGSLEKMIIWSKS